MLDGLGIGNQVLILQTQALRVEQEKEPYIGLTQENSIENSVQGSLSYIPIYIVHASYCAPYSKLPCVSLKVNMHCAHCMTSSFQNLLCPSICYVTVTVTVSSDVTDV